MLQIIPTLFSTSEEGYKKRIDTVLSSESLKEAWVHIDLMDNKFVRNQGVSLDVLKKYPVNRNKEAHLMVLDPEAWVEGLVEIKVNRIIFPLEVDIDIRELIDRIKSSGIEASLSLNPQTQVEKLEPFIKILDGILLMGIMPGSEGQQLDSTIFEKIKAIRTRGWGVTIGVDGGVKDSNIRELLEAGVDYVAVGSFLFNGGIDENLEKIWEKVK